ncbi:hypothetical protein CMI38_07050 [Candidatus Pacearchaeota archaeon]|nr:hypothetical protein [Candidatus Pacearchaeota archaeon]|tara:strand:+ start:2860 stop:3192 length:333 start_codon:yes stop_codon:yes gene_type:complete
MNKGVGFSYDSIADSLIISRKKDNEVVSGSTEVGDLILDFTNEGKIVSVEFQNISEFLETVGVESNILSELESAELVVRESGGAVALLALLKTRNFERAVPLANVPLVVG